MRLNLIILFFFITGQLFAQVTMEEKEQNLWLISQSAPPEMWNLLSDADLEKDYEVNVTGLNPFYYSADFDGDNKNDFAIQMIHKEDKSKRMVILGGDKKIYWLDRDDELEYPTLTAWYIYPEEFEIEKGVGENNDPPQLKGDGLMIIKVEASSSLIYWNGKRFVSYWQGD